MKSKDWKKYQVKGEDLMKKVKEIIKEGNVRQIVIKSDEGQVYLRLPVTVGIIGTLLVPILAVVGALAAMAGVFTIEVERKTAKSSPKNQKKH